MATLAHRGIRASIWWCKNQHHRDSLGFRHVIAFDDQAGNLKSVVLRTYGSEVVRSLNVGDVGVLKLDIPQVGEFPYGWMRVSAKFVDNLAPDEIIRWVIAFKPTEPNAAQWNAAPEGRIEENRA